MAKPKRANVYKEAWELAESWLNGNKSHVVERVTRAGSMRQVLPALVYKKIQNIEDKAADQFLKMVIDVSVRD